MGSLSGLDNTNRGDDHKAKAAIEERAFTPTQWQSDRTLCLTVSREIYSLKAILSAAYKFSSDYAVWVDVESDHRWSVAIISSERIDSGAVLALFTKELIDQQLRVALEQEFGNLRTLIVAQAFSEGNLLDSQE
jgi:His-Xaa-Ser system protein HxsD